MVDKVWYDWQTANSANAGIFYGGSVQMIDNATIYAEYPNGGPPMLSVCDSRDLDPSRFTEIFLELVGLCYACRRYV